MRLGGAEAPIPYSPVLEKAAVPQVEDIVTARAASGAGRDLSRGGRDRHAARRHGHDVRPDGPLACSRGRACRQRADAVRDRDRQGGDGGRRAGLGRAEVRRGLRGRRAAGRNLHRLDRRRGREFRAAGRERAAAPGARRRRLRSQRSPHPEKGSPGRDGARPLPRGRPGGRPSLDGPWGEGAGRARRAPPRDARRPAHGARARIAARELERVRPARTHSGARRRAAQRRPASASNVHRLWLARGQGAPIVFLHGFGADLNGWRPVHRLLPETQPALAIDLPGHGLSPLGEEASFEALVEAARAVLIEEGISAAHLVGHSLGGAVAAALAHEPGVKALSLMLIAPAGLGEETNAPFFDGFLMADTEAALTLWLNMLATDPAALGSALAKTTLRLRRERPLVAEQRRLAAAIFAARPPDDRHSRPSHGPAGADQDPRRPRGSDHPGPSCRGLKRAHRAAPLSPYRPHAPSRSAARGGGADRGACEGRSGFVALRRARLPRRVRQPARGRRVGHQRGWLERLDRAEDRRLLVGAAGGEHPDRGGAHGFERD